MELQDIVRRLRMKQSIKAIKRETGKHRRVIRRVLELAGQEGWLDAKRELPSEHRLQEVYHEQRDGTDGRSHPLDAHRDRIKAWHRDGYSFLVIHELLQQRGVEYSETTVRRYIHRQFPSPVRPVMRRETKAGEVMEVDFGHLGLYIVRSNVEPELFDAEQTVTAYKDLAKVERAFRSMKTVDLKVRPIYHRGADRVRAHVFLCMLAYYVEWHMRSKLAPVLFDDHDPAAGEQLRESVVQPAQRSPAAHRKAANKRTDDGLPVHSFRGLMSELGTLTANRVRMVDSGATFTMHSEPTALQQRCFDLLGVSAQV